MFAKFSGKVADGPQKNPLDCGRNLDHVTLELWLTFSIVPGSVMVRRELCQNLQHGIFTQPLFHSN